MLDRGNERPDVISRGREDDPATGGEIAEGVGGDATVVSIVLEESLFE